VDASVTVLFSESVDVATADVSAFSLRCDGVDVAFTVSGSTTTFTLNHSDFAYDASCDVDTCIKHADEMLYAGKRGGRNRVVSTLNLS